MISLVHRKIYRGPEPSDADWTELKALGVRYDLDLETGILHDGKISDERGKATSMGVRFYGLPFSFIEAPTRHDLYRAATFLAQVSEDGIYVHCRDGVDRTGMVCAKYRMVTQGWSKQAAVGEMKKMGMHWWYYWWAWFL